jgi:glyoxylase-like metal-dependent hydrolase (beta-lactamase superfamily II)
MNASPETAAVSSIDPEQTTVTVDVLHAGAVGIDRSLAYEERTWHPVPETGWFRSDSKRIWVPVSAYLLSHPEGTVLVDTGWHTDVRTDERGHLGRLLASMFDTRLPDGAAVTEQLAARDLTPADLASVVVTHMHSDHVSGLELVRDAPEILVSERAFADATNRFSPNRCLAGHMWEGIELSPFELEETGIGPSGRSHDLFGDGAIQLVWTPGHDEGQIAILARTAEGWVLLASDVVYGRQALQDGTLPGLITDRDAARRSLEWVRSVADRSDCVAVLPNHDPNVQPGLITAE